MQTFQDLLDQILATGKPITLEFVKGKPNEFGVYDMECYLEPGMRGVITGGQKERNADVLTLNIDYTLFDAFNISFETPNYFGAEGKPNLTAREANQYKIKESLYVDAAMPVSQLARVVDEPAMGLYAAWQKAGVEGTYVSFLEAKVLAAEPQPETPSNTAPRRVRPG